jgi:hypothetical protein
VLEALFALLAEVFIEGGIALLFEVLTRAFQGIMPSFRSRHQLSLEHDPPEPTLFDWLADAVPLWLRSMLLSAAVGAAMGMLSLLIFTPGERAPGVLSAFWRHANLLLSPLLCGTAMAMLGAWRSRRGLSVLSLDRFLCGWVFAQALVGVRFVLG